MTLTEAQSIKKFYEASEVFITGGSGYIGKVLIEKLLRSCPRIKTIHVLLREKKNKSLTERINELSDCLLFDRLKEQDCEALAKVVPVKGDASKLNLGLCDADLDKLKSCSVIFHAAASVRFDDPLKSAILLNTRGTREVCKLALAMPNLKAFVHVSTAYIQPKNLYVKEILYPAEDNWKTFVDYAENFDEEVLNVLTPKLTKFAPNTYTFTKHLAEQVCIDYKKEFNLPIVIFRPSIVGVSENDPMIGWCDNLNGPMGLVLVGVLGVNHVVNCSGSNKMDVVPVDFCVKGMIISAWKAWKDQQETAEQLDIPLYNATTIKIVSYNSLVANIEAFARDRPSLQTFGIPHVTFTTCVTYAWILRILRNLIPAIIADTIAIAVGSKPRLLKTHRLIFNSEKSLGYFDTHNFTFDNFNFVDLQLSIPHNEIDEFSLSEKVFCNRDYYFESYKLLLKVIFGETDKDAEVAMTRYRYVYVVTRCIHVAVILAALKLFSVLFQQLL